MERLTLRLRIDSADLQAMVEEIGRLRDAAPPWLRWLSAQATKHPEDLFHLVPCNPKGEAAGATGDVFFVANPTDQLLRLLAALRAAEGDGGAWVWDELHGGPHV